MTITYFKDTDTLLVNFTKQDIHETKDLNENILLDLDKNGNVVSMTIEHAGKQAEQILALNFEYDIFISYRQ